MVFGLLTVGVLLPHAPAMRQTTAILLAPLAFAPELPPVVAAASLALGSALYAAWLAGATVSGWRMPVKVHLAPLLALVGTLVLGPLRASAAIARGASDARAIDAMSLLAERLERVPDPCALGPRELEGFLPPESMLSGYREHGWALVFRLVPAEQAAGPVREIRPADGPATLRLSCAKNRSRFWLTAVVADSQGKASMARDGVGKVAVVEGEGRP